MANKKSEAAKAKNTDKKGGETTEETSIPTDEGTTEAVNGNSNSQNLSVRVAGTNAAAKDDYFTAENTDWLAETGGLTGSLDVLANDPGSAHIVAVHGEAPSGAGMIEPATEATAIVEHNGAEYEVTVMINDDGTLSVDASGLSGNLDLA